MESIDLVPLDGDISKITRRAEDLKDWPDSIQQNLQTLLTLTMDLLAITHRRVKNSMGTEGSKQAVSIIYA